MKNRVSAAVVNVERARGDKEQRNLKAPGVADTNQMPDLF
jgi:hypothetical protein